jgi:hypothetical protein
MQQALREYLCEGELATHWRAVETAETLEAMMAAAWGLARALVLWMMSEVLAGRAAQPVSWPECPVCGERMRSQRLEAAAMDGRAGDREVAQACRALPAGVQDRAGGAPGSGVGSASASAHPCRRAGAGLSVGGMVAV